MADVFISYKSERRAAAEHLADILEDHGYSVWFDYALATGGSFSEQIARELEAAKCVVVLWCSLSVESIWVRREASFAQDREKICPAFIENVSLPFPFHYEQTINLRNWDGAPRAGQPASLLKEIELHTGKPPQPDAQLLARAEKAWKRYGSQSLAKFALGKIVQEQEAEPKFGNEVSAHNKTLSMKDTESTTARLWEQIKHSNEMNDFDDFLIAFPNAPEVKFCEAAKAALQEDLKLQKLTYARKVALKNLPTTGLDVAVFDNFIEEFSGTEEAYEAVKLRRKCLERIKAKDALDEIRKKKNLLHRKIITGRELPQDIARNQRELQLHSNDLSDLSAFSNLINLQTLSLKSDYIEDISALGKLTSLWTLRIEGRRLSNLQPLSQLSQLKFLDIRNTNVTDVTALRFLTELTNLRIRNSPVSDVSILNQLPKLEVVDLWGTNAKNLPPLSHVRKLYRYNGELRR